MSPVGEHRGKPPQLDGMRRFGGRGVAAFGEMLVVGLAVTALSLPVVTAVPALAAGVRHLESHLTDRPDSVRGMFSLAWAAIRSGWLFGLGSALIVGLLLLNVALGVQGLVPGGAAFAAVSGALAAVVAVVACRVAALWTPGRRWATLWREGRSLAVGDPAGSALVLAGLGVGLVVAWMLPPLIVIAPGLTAVALVAAERRRRTAEEGNG
ncbi:hypothetical protein [uncultured Leifsonia sp.]|uniref:hypothetical protein n=1 Tax=uncultured Leifsonia sp. TaxID=340359 RepID=UPI0028D3195E|nr:hypothetical protein [uncultured Leifsonia sp.]